MTEKGKTYEIFCKRGFNRDNCKFRKQDKELYCSICSFAGFIERTANNEKKQTVEQETKVHSKDGQ